VGEISSIGAVQPAEPPLLRFVVALPAEARPLIERFGMAAVGDGPFPVFRGEDAWLVVSGHGKACAAAATAYLHLLSGGVLGCAWLNVGLGGHGQRTLGEGVVAHKISDAASGASWYPQLVIDSPSPTVPVLTVERVEDEYVQPWIYESEAAGFFPIACRFSTAELVHCYKVVSDNPDATLSRRMSSSSIEELIAGNLEAVEVFARGLADLAWEAESIAMAASADAARSYQRR
jgi:adenosylhomocysteine nucleosidase